MFELTPDERMKAFRRRQGKFVKRGELSPEMIRRFTTSVTFQSTLMKEFTNVLDYGKDVYCPSCAITTDHGAVTAWPLAPLLGKNPMADKGDAVTFTCLHCGFVEHHVAPEMPRDEALHAADALRYKYEEMQRQMGKQSALSAMYGGPRISNAGLQNASAEIEHMRREAERLSRMVNSPPMRASDDAFNKGIGQAFADYVRKHTGL